jgi:hypothetical protein
MSRDSVYSYCLQHCEVLPVGHSLQDRATAKCSCMGRWGVRFGFSLSWWQSDQEHLQQIKKYKETDMKRRLLKASKVYQKYPDRNPLPGKRKW